MSCGGLIILGVAALSLHQAPVALNGTYSSSCGTSYCRGIHASCAPNLKASSYLNEPTGYGYSVKYNYGVQPDWVTLSTPSIGSNSYNYGR